MIDLSRTAVIIPALNEADSLRSLLPILSGMKLGQILVCDNGSTDDTPTVIGAHGATHIVEPVRGYGAACWAGMEALADTIDVVVFLDADLSDDPHLLPEFVRLIETGPLDFVVSSRVASLREPGAMTFPQRVANILMPFAIRVGWGFRYTDLGP
ncbi:MAG: glycosyltransferase family 2 protein, partial [Planctomycetota bacterium]